MPLQDLDEFAFTFTYVPATGEVIFEINGVYVCTANFLQQIATGEVDFSSIYYIQIKNGFSRLHYVNVAHSGTDCLVND